MNKNRRIYEYNTEGINIVYSKNGDIGNYVGKSTLLKSLYHALGADAIFDNTKGWEADCKYYYILGFSIDDKKYNIVRHNRYFAIYNECNNIIFSTNNREKIVAYEKFIEDTLSQNGYKNAIIMLEWVFDGEKLIFENAIFFSHLSN